MIKSSTDGPVLASTVSAQIVPADAMPADAMPADAMPADAMLTVLWDGIGMGLALYDGSGQRVMINAAGRRILGPDSSSSRTPDVAGRVVYVADGVTVLPQAQWPLQRALAGESVRAEQLLIRDDDHPDGRRTSVSAYPIPLDDGPGALVAFADVTAQWHNERATSASLDQLSMLLDGAAGYVIMQLGPAGEIRSWSRSAQALLGYERDEVLGQPWAILFPAGDIARDVPGSLLSQARSIGQVHTGGARIRKDGTTFWADGVLTVVKDGDGEVVAFVKVLHDVTPRYQAERAVEALNRELQELNEGFSYSVSHDLRAPIRAVHGFARLLRERHLGSLPDEGQFLLDRIEQSAVRMGELIDALLRYSRMQRQPMRAQPIDMTALVRRCWLDVMDEYPRGQAELVLGELTPVTGDEQLLRQVWVNLIDNAVKFSQHSPAPVITISSRVDGDELVFEVRDNGIGFDQRYASKLFGVFQRIHPGEEYPGVGIGLAIAARLVQRHSGRVWARSENGCGATFSFALPVARALAVTSGQAVSSGQAASGGR